ncbi:MAG: hypothetical protein ACYCTL_12715 [Acidimicrobiales bacterium]
MTRRIPSPVWGTWRPLVVPVLLAAGSFAALIPAAEVATVGVLAGAVLIPLARVLVPSRHRHLVLPDLLDAGQSVTTTTRSVTITTDPLQRGVHATVPAVLTSSWPSGVGWRRRVVLTPPPPLLVAPVPAPAATAAKSTPTPRGLRSWAPGDPARSIQLRASARHCELVVAAPAPALHTSPAPPQARIDIVLDPDDGTAPVLLRTVLDQLETGPVLVAYLVGGRVVEQVVPTPDDARRILAVAEVGQWD